MKRNTVIAFLFLVLFSVSIFSVTKKSSNREVFSSAPQQLSLEGWIDVEQDNSSRPRFNTDFDVDTSALDKKQLKQYLSEKVVLKGIFVTDSSGNLVYKAESLVPAPKASNEDSTEDGSLEVDMTEEGH